MRRTLLFVLPLLAVFCSPAWAQAMSEYGALSAGSATGTSKAGGAAAKALSAVGKRLGDATANSPASSAPTQRLSASPETLMRSNRQLLEQKAQEHGGAMLHISSAPKEATLYVDHLAIASTPADLRLPVGKHILELKSPAFLNWSQEVSVSAGETLSFEPNLQANRQAQSEKRIINLSF